MEGDTLFYDLVTERGKIKKGQTNLNDAFYQGKEIISDKNSNIYSFDGIYTSCDLDHPHYYFLILLNEQLYFNFYPVFLWLLKPICSG